MSEKKSEETVNGKKEFTTEEGQFVIRAWARRKDGGITYPKKKKALKIPVKSNKS